MRPVEVTPTFQAMSAPPRWVLRKSAHLGGLLACRKSDWQPTPGSRAMRKLSRLAQRIPRLPLRAINGVVESFEYSHGGRSRRPSPMSKPRKKKRPPKRVLALPDLEQSKAAVLNSLSSESGQRTYDHAITEFVNWYCSEPRLAFNRTVVLRYRIYLEQKQYAPTTINLRLAAVRRVAFEAADSGLLSPELAAGIRRVKGVRRIGVRVGNWLSV